MKPKTDTPYKKSWTDQEFQRTHTPITQTNFSLTENRNKNEIIGYKKVEFPKPTWHLKPSILIPNLVTIGKIEAKSARIFNG